MGIVSITLISTLVLTISTKIGFFIQKVYFDVVGIALAAFLSIITGLVTLAYPILAIILSCSMFMYLLCKIGDIELLPDAILASIIGIGVLGIIIVKNINLINVF